MLNLNINAFHIIRNKSIIIFLLLLAGAFMILSCENDIEKINLITNTNDLPNHSAKNIKIVHTDSARLRLTLEAPELNGYTEIEKPYTEFPQGLKASFYNRSENLESVITAEYAIYFDETEIWEAKNNVVAKNVIENRKLETEQLFWDQKNELLYSEKFVKVTTEDEIIYGDGFESDQNFTKWKILKPKGTINLKEE